MTKKTEAQKKREIAKKKAEKKLQLEAELGRVGVSINKLDTKRALIQKQWDGLQQKADQILTKLKQME